MVVTGLQHQSLIETGLARSASALARALAADRSTSLLDLVRDRLDWVEVRVQGLAAIDGRQDALLCPRSTGGFVIVIDPAPSPTDTAAGRELSEVIDGRLAHELGHTHFFTGEPPRRWLAWTPEEEGLADRFANLLLRQVWSKAA